MCICVGVCVCMREREDKIEDKQNKDLRIMSEQKVNEEVNCGWESGLNRILRLRGS